MFRRYRIRAVRRRAMFKLLLFALTAFACLILLKIILSATASYEARQTVDQFYQYETEGKFADSWEMFHPFMKERFSKPHYIQDRAHVFMNHFGVSTFSYSLGRITKIKHWTMTSSADPLEQVYKTTVTKTYKGKYGNFRITQEVFTTKEDGRWTVLWDYNRE